MKRISKILLVLWVVFPDTALGWAATVSSAHPSVSHILDPGSECVLTLSAIYQSPSSNYDGGSVDLLVINSGGVVLFSTSVNLATDSGLRLSSDMFTNGIAIIGTWDTGGNYVITDSFFLLVKPQTSYVYTYGIEDIVGCYISLSDMDQDGVFDAIIFDLHTLQLPGSAMLPMAYKCRVSGVLRPTAFDPVSRTIEMEDVTLDALISSASSDFRDSWLADLRLWLDRWSDEEGIYALSQAKSYAQQMESALSSGDTELFHDLWFGLPEQ